MHGFCKSIPLAFMLLASVMSMADGTNAMLHTVADISAAIRSKTTHARFRLEVLALSSARDDGTHVFLAEDASGRELFLLYPEKDPDVIQPGTRLRIDGETGLSGGKAVHAFVWDATVLGKIDMPPPQEAAIADILDGKHNLQYIRVKGQVVDAFYDDIDRHYLFLILMQDGARIYVPIRKRSMEGIELPYLIGAEVSIRAIASERDKSGRRQYSGVSLCFIGFDYIRKVGTLVDTNKIPPLEDLHGVRPDSIHALGQRKTSGRVVAVWKGNRFLLMDRSGELMRVDLTDDTPPPKCGAEVEVVGFVDTDLFNINFSRAIWRPSLAEDISPPQGKPTEVTAENLLSKENDLNVIAAQHFGQVVALKGVVRSLPALGNNDGRMLLESGEFMIPIDASSCPEAFDGLAVDCRVHVTGVFVFEAENWRANAIFPKIDDIAIVVRRPEDVVVLSRPSWWTPFRLLVVIGVLSVAIAIVLLWNASLRVLAERRGRALYRARISKAASELRVDERTRLATELHDYVAQDMTAISYQVTAAKLAHETDSAACAQHLETAERMLGSCRTELRRCLWDLRNEALDERDMAKAVETSIAPIIGDEAISIKMDVQRSSLDDSTMHSMMSIVRELTANAIKHGHADLISIKGEVKDGHLILTVSDDGAGFDPATSPGAAQGHFGLAGARERALQHGGDITVESAPGKGTKITVSLKLTPNMAAEM